MEQQLKPYRGERPPPPEPQAGPKVQVASVNLLLKILKKDVNHTLKIIKKGKFRHGWSNRMVFKAPRATGKPGGQHEWVATASVLEQISKDF